jgi:hypothetical protein
MLLSPRSPDASTHVDVTSDLFFLVDAIMLSLCRIVRYIARILHFRFPLPSQDRTKLLEISDSSSRRPIFEEHLVNNVLPRSRPICEHYRASTQGLSKHIVSTSG